MAETNRGTRDFISWLNFYLRVAGIRSSCLLVDDFRILYHVVVLSLSCVGSWILFYHKYSDFSVNTNILNYAIMSGHTLYVYCVYLRSRRKLCRLATLMQTHFGSSFGRYDQVWDKSDNFSTLLMKCGLYSSTAMMVFYFFNSKPFSPDRKLIYQMWVPPSLQGDAEFFLVFCLQLSVFFLYCFVHVSGCGLCIGGAHFIGASFDVLGLTFQDMCEKRVMFEGNLTKKQSNKFSVDEKMKPWVKKHNILLRFVKDYKSVFEAVLLEVMLSCEVIICFSGFQIVLAIEGAQSQAVGMLVGTILVFVFHLFMFFYPGQHIYNKSEKLRFDLYGSQWEQQSLLFQKHLVLILTNTLKPVTICYKNTLHSSMSSFLHALRTAYSYVNILLILRRT